MPEYLAELMVETGKRMGKKIVALITDMEQPLGRKVGNALEVEECIEIIHGKARPICANCVGALGLDVFAGRQSEIRGGRPRAGGGDDRLRKARETFREIIRLQGGDPRMVDHPDPLPGANIHGAQ